VAVGQGRLNDQGERLPFQVKKGDRVLFKSYAGTDVKLDGNDYILMSEEDILAVID
jgi:chaperonin GroES